ncbi:MAG: divergent polysaccharide deacetylase family protein, partial [Pseudorhodobacter sp.]
MARGLGAGLVWGGLVAGLGLGAVSLVVPLPVEGPIGSGSDSTLSAPLGGLPEPEPGATAVAPPADSVADAAPLIGFEAEMPDPGSPVEAVDAGEEPSGPANDLLPGTGPDVAIASISDIVQPESGTLPRLPQAGSPLPQEQAAPLPLNGPDLAEAGPTAQTGDAPIEVAVGVDSASLPVPVDQVSEAAAPGAAPDSQVIRPEGPARPGAPAADPQPEVEASLPAPPPAVVDAAEEAIIGEVPADAGTTERQAANASETARDERPDAAEARPGSEALTEPRPADAVPVRRPGATSGQGDAGSPAPRFAGAVDGVTTGRLPSIAAPGAGSATPPATQAMDGGAVEPPGAEAPAYIQFARSFENPGSKPVFAIVLRDTGGPEIDREALAALPFPVSFAIDPSLPDAETAATIYRRAGQEVVMLATGLPQGATASDVEVTFEVHGRTLAEAVAVLDSESGGVQGNRILAQQVLAVVKGQGRGILSWERGLNAASQIARRDGMQNAVIFRSLDGEGETGPLIRRYLDRAAFKAAQEGRVIVAGTTRPETVAAILEWTVEGRAD